MKRGSFVFVIFFVLLISLFLVSSVNLDFVSPTPSAGSVSENYIPVNLSSSSDGDYYSFVNFNNDLRFWMRFDDLNSSGSPLDLSGNSYNGVIVGDVDINNSGSKWGNVSHFNGGGTNSDYILLSGLGDLGSNMDQSTFSFWLKWDHSNAWQSIFGGRDSLSEEDLSISINRNANLDQSAGDISFFLDDSSGNRLTCGTTSQSYNDGNWHHFVIVFSDLTTSSGNKFYVDGSSVSSSCSRADSAMDKNDNFASLTLGARSVPPTNYVSFEGQMDEVLIFTRNLTASEILSLYNSSANSYFNNFTNLNTGTYKVLANAVNSSGDRNETNRTFILGDTSISLNYPSNNTLFQRHNSSHGEIKIVGTSSHVGDIEANFNGEGWKNISAEYNGDVFTGFLNASVSQGNLSVRFTGLGSSNTVYNISVGDLFVIAGQSNAEGRATNAQSLNSSNLYVSTVYRQDDVWKVANDPFDTNSILGTPFPLVANYIIQNQSVPVSFITTAEGATSIVQWQDTYYDSMIDQITEATNGTMKVKVMLWHQGESDANPSTGTDGDYTAYKNNLTNIVFNFINDTEIAEKAIVAQIGYKTTGSTTRERMDNIRRAQKDLWDENENISAGPTLYDIGPLSDGVHLKTDTEIEKLADRWWASIGKVVYNVGDGRGPKLINASFANSANTSIRLVFSEESSNIVLRQWDSDVSQSTSGGWRVLAGSNVFDDTDVTSTDVVGNEVYINFSSGISGSSNISLGSFNDGSDENLVRDDSEFSLPAESFWQVSIAPMADVNSMINVLSPMNTSYSYSNIFVNATSNNVIDEWTLNYNGTNYTITINSVFNFLEGQGYNLKLWGENSSGSFILNDSIYFSVDLTYPELSIVSPTSTIYTNNSEPVIFNVSATDVSVDSCWYSLDNGISNQSLSREGSSNYYSHSSSSISNGNYTALFWCNDSAGNLNNTENVSFEILMNTALSYSSPTLFSGDLIFDDTIDFRLISSESGINVTLYDSNKNLVDYFYSSGTNAYSSFSVDSPGVYYLNATTDSYKVETRNYLLIFSEDRLWSEEFISTDTIDNSSLGLLGDSDNYGYSIANIGDLDSDGVQDLLVGAPGDDSLGVNRGAVYIHLMYRNGSIKSTFEINSSTLNGPTLENTDLYGYSVANLGDLDLDGTQDIIVCSPESRGGAIVGNYGDCYIHFINDSLRIKSTVNINLVDLGIADSLIGDYYYGSSVASLGDLDLDGVQDIGIGSIVNNTLFVHFMQRNGSVKSTVEINSFTLNGPSVGSGDYYGSSVANIGDLNLDGIQDIVVGARADDVGGTDYGVVFIHFMQRNGSVKSTVEISSLTSNGPSLLDNSNYGFSVANIGDLDLDGIQDIAVGAYGHDSNNGSIFVHFMNRDGSVKSTFEMNSLTLNGPSLPGSSNYGSSVASLGDLNLDGIQDVVSGSEDSEAFYLTYLNYSVADISFVSSTPFSGDLIFNDTINFNLTSFENGINVTLYDSNGSLVNYYYSPDKNFSGEFSVSSSGIYYLNASTESYTTETRNYLLIYTDRLWDFGFDSTVEINSSTLNGPVLENDDYYGFSVANLGDLNLDGVPDIAVGARADDAGGTDRGVLHIHFMNRDGSINSTVEINSSTLNGPVLENNDYYGFSVANIGDLDLDGIQDIAVGIRADDGAGVDEGAIVIHFMNRDGSIKSTVEINSSVVNAPVIHDSDFYGSSIANLGDLDLDGIQDLVVGAARGGESSDSGCVFIHFMNSNGSIKFTTQINYDDLAGGTFPSSYYGSSVANIGDLDLDGVQDIIVGARQDDSGGTDRGVVFIHFMNMNGSVKSTVEINSSTLNGPVLNDSDYYGFSIANLGDLDLDGVQDIGVGAVRHDSGGTDFGVVFVHFMNMNGSIKSTIEINSSTLNGPFLNDGDNYGFAITSFGDLNLDGIQDMVVGARSDDAGGQNRGAVHIHFLNSVEKIPDINVLSPSNGQTFTSSSVLFSATSSQNIDSWIVDYDGTNRTLSSINTSLDLSNGNYNLKLWGRSSHGFFGLSDSISFSVNIPEPEESSGGSLTATNPVAVFQNNSYVIDLGDEGDYLGKTEEIEYGYIYHFTFRDEENVLKLKSIDRQEQVANIRINSNDYDLNLDEHLNFTFDGESLLLYLNDFDDSNPIIYLRFEAPEEVNLTLENQTIQNETLENMSIIEEGIEAVEEVGKFIGKAGSSIKDSIVSIFDSESESIEDSHRLSRFFVDIGTLIVILLILIVGFILIGKLKKKKI